MTTNARGVWVDVTPLDDLLDGGGIAASGFVRTFPLTTVVTLTAHASQDGQPLAGWKINGQWVVDDGGLVSKSITNLRLTIDDPETVVEVIYGATGPLPQPANENADAQSSEGLCASGVFLLGPFMLAFLGIRFRRKKGSRR